VAGSSRSAAVAFWFLFAVGCSVGHGSGELHGEVEISGCNIATGYQLNPTAFFAQAVEDLLRIRVQRGSDVEVRSDGVAILVEEASVIKSDYLGQSLDVAPGSEPRVDVSVYLNESCPPGRDRTPVVLSAVSGTIRFRNIYAPEADDDDVRIRAELTDVRFEDPRNAKRNATLSGFFDFLYVRGSPAQRFP
jgi:hypothetical protein